VFLFFLPFYFPFFALCCFLEHVAEMQHHLMPFSFQDFLLCSVCVGRVELYNKVAHQKYLMYIECAKRVAEKRSSDPYKDTTIILNELLADEAWLNQVCLFL
jgi:hypothetical protein